MESSCQDKQQLLGRKDSLAPDGKGTAPLMATCAEIPHLPAKGCGEHWHQELLCPLVFDYRGWPGAGLHFPTPPGWQGGGGIKQQLLKMHTPFHIYLHEMTESDCKQDERLCGRRCEDTRQGPYE